MKAFLRTLAVILSVLYPVLVFVFLYFLKIPTRIFSLFVIIVAVGIFLSLTGKKNDGGKISIDPKQVITSLLLLTAGVLCFLTNQIFFLKLYSVSVSAVFLVLFGSTLFIEPTMVFRFATLSDKSIVGSTCEGEVKKYCRTVTVVWCCFFIFNGTVSVLTAFSQNIFNLTPQKADTLWTVYNGGISYVLMGLLFAGEFCVRKIYERHLVKAVPVSKIGEHSRKESHIVCVSRKNKTEKKTWGDFLYESEILRKKISASGENKIILPNDDIWAFLITLTASLQCKKIPVIDFKNKGATSSATYRADFSHAKKAKHTEDIPALQSKQALIQIGSDANGTTLSLYELESEIDAEINRNGKNLILQKTPVTLNAKSEREFLYSLLLNFTLGLRFKNQNEN